MRFVRVPYVYLPDVQVRMLYSFSNMLLKVIHDVHHDIPNEKWRLPYVKAFMYHPSFIRWVFVKSKKEMIRRGVDAKISLSDAVIQLKSKPLAEFVPATEADLAQDVVWLLDNWKGYRSPGGSNLPWSYVELTKEHYGYTPQQAALERVDQVSGRHRDSDSDWYYLEDQEKAQIDRNSLGSRIRSRGNAQG